MKHEKHGRIVAASSSFCVELSELYEEKTFQNTEGKQNILIRRAQREDKANEHNPNDYFAK